MMNSVGLSVADSPYETGFYAFSRHYHWDLSTRGKPFPSSELAFVIPALAVNKVISGDGLFDIVALGIVHLIGYCAVITIFAYCGFRSRLRWRWLIYLAVIVLFSDVTYIAYFNSLYAEPASLIFLCGGLAFAMLAIIEAAAERPRTYPLLGCFVCWILFLLAKLQNVMLVPLLAPIVYLMYVNYTSRADGAFKSLRAKKWQVLIAFIGIAFAYWSIYSIFPMGVRNVNVYNNVFFEIIKKSPTPKADLKDLGLNESYLKYKGTHSWSPGITEKLHNDVYNCVGEKGVMLFYIKHPSRLCRLLWSAAKYSFETRPGYLGNFDSKSYANILHEHPNRKLAPGESTNAECTGFERFPSFCFSHSFAFSSGFKERFIVGSSWSLLIFIVINFAAIGWKLRWRDRDISTRSVSLIHLALLLMAIFQFLTVTIGTGEMDLVRHLFLFGLLCDLCTVFLLGYLVELFAPHIRAGQSASGV
ncbi:MAG: hypothetical protein ABFD54_15675 [Armatimonadota bacterium]|nr:hypothetical protein [bacterium]